MSYLNKHVYCNPLWPAIDFFLIINFNMRLHSIPYDMQLKFIELHFNRRLIPSPMAFNWFFLHNQFHSICTVNGNSQCTWNIRDCTLSISNIPRHLDKVHNAPHTQLVSVRICLSHRMQILFNLIFCFLWHTVVRVIREACIVKLVKTALDTLFNQCFRRSILCMPFKCPNASIFHSSSDLSTISISVQS